MSTTNPLGMQGLAFVELAGPDPDALDVLLRGLGFSRLKRHTSRDLVYYRQGEIHFVINREPDSFAGRFRAHHGPCIASMGLRFNDAERAHATCVARGARPYLREPEYGRARAVYGIGESLIHFVDDGASSFLQDFVDLDNPLHVPSMGFVCIDHLTNNVYKGTLESWSSFYKTIFDFTEVRTFDIRGEKTGLHSYALRSPCGTFCIPINEGSEKKSQIEEYLEEYRGPGIQHLAFLTHDLLSSLDALAPSRIETLDIDPSYYAEAFARVPALREDRARVMAHQVLVDGDDQGYLLQIFTKNLIGPIFIEMIQRENHLSFGEGNFGALFRSIERDQERRGVLCVRVAVAASTRR